MSQNPESFLRAMAAPLALAREGDPLPVVRFSLEAVANAFMVLGLLPAARAEEILAAQRPALEAAGFQVALPIGELTVTPETRRLLAARAAGADGPRRTPLAVAAGPVRCRLGGHDLTITSATLTPEGISVCCHGVARDGGHRAGAVIGAEAAEAVARLSVTDDTGATYVLPPGGVPGSAAARSLASGRVLWVPEGEFPAAAAAGEPPPREAAPGESPSGDPAPVPGPSASGEAGSRGGRPAVRWLELSAGSGESVRIIMLPPAVVPVGTAQTPWPTPAECYLAELASISEDWGIGSFETGAVQLDTAGIVAAVADALLAVGALPEDSALLARLPYREPADWREALVPRWGVHAHAYETMAAPGTGRESGSGLVVRLPLSQATAVIENVAVHDDLVSVQLYGHPWVIDGSWPMITPGFRVTAADDTGTEYWGEFVIWSEVVGWSGACTGEGTGSCWFSSPVPPKAKQLRVTVSTLWEAAWALIDIPGR
ncbi:MAG: hypothetical protein JOY82_05205 [Streptosporangiaceae bacterium]|nr:hypothetical protein [Streptosporangiaceae bacterium]MBV9853907.1 hypothetical protein [Streptosporangiaceae bacterium]